ncbi:MAG TPA: hypothetical protein VFC02_11610, partial [Anaerolineales bacterium]|nr:hypothetical protein [Anaerolineales bacterium]
LERIGELISNLYLTFGLMSMFTIMSITLQVNPLTSLIKQLIFIGMIPVGASGIGKLFSRLQKENEN